jgi:hypothetical protein
LSGTIWIAPSSLRGVNGYGVYTTRYLKAGESVLGRPDGVAIPFEPYLHRMLPPRADRKKFLNLFGEYMWGRGIPDHSTYESPDRGYVMDYQVGFGSLPNHHCVLSYLDILYPDPPYVDTLADRFKDPSAGAFSYNRGREFIVTRPVEAGSEIFLDYGYCERPDPTSSDAAGGPQSPSWTEGMYVTQDFQDAADLIRQHLQHHLAGTSNVLFHNVTGRLIVPPGTSDKVASLLPKSEPDLQQLYGKYYQTELVRQVALNSLDRKSVESIRETGTCLDNLAARQSTLPLAGQGGFAQRRIKSGQIIVPAPFLQVTNKESLHVYNRAGERNGTQLLLNYCWGHAESTLLLCPNTNAILLNSCSDRTRECGADGPNAAYRWSSDQVTQRWLNMSWDELTSQTGRGLAMEIVALRDIKAGEEVFIDYGVEWEEAWAAHVAGWKPPPLPSSSEPWITARDANDNHGSIIDSLVTRDIRQTPDHPYLFTGCVYWMTEWDTDRVFQQRGLDWKNSMTDDELLRTFSDPGSMYAYFDYARGYRHHSDRIHWPCTVVRPDNDDETTYLVRIHQAPWWRGTNDGASLPWHDNDLPRLLREYPRSSIHYFVHPYASDQHLPGVFRYELRIRDDLFPEQWKNLRYES